MSFKDAHFDQVSAEMLQSISTHLIKMVEDALQESQHSVFLHDYVADVPALEQTKSPEDISSFAAESEQLFSSFSNNEIEEDSETLPSLSEEAMQAFTSEIESELTQEAQPEQQAAAKQEESKTHQVKDTSYAFFIKAILEKVQKQLPKNEAGNQAEKALSKILSHSDICAVLAGSTIPCLINFVDFISNLEAKKIDLSTLSGYSIEIIEELNQALTNHFAQGGTFTLHVEEISDDDGNENVDSEVLSKEKQLDEKYYNFTHTVLDQVKINLQNQPSIVNYLESLGEKKHITQELSNSDIECLKNFGLFLSKSRQKAIDPEVFLDNATDIISTITRELSEVEKRTSSPKIEDIEEAVSALDINTEFPLDTDIPTFSDFNLGDITEEITNIALDDEQLLPDLLQETEPAKEAKSPVELKPEGYIEFVAAILNQVKSELHHSPDALHLIQLLLKAENLIPAISETGIACLTGFAEFVELAEKNQLPIENLLEHREGIVNALIGELKTYQAEPQPEDATSEKQQLEIEQKAVQSEPDQTHLAEKRKARHEFPIADVDETLSLTDLFVGKETLPETTKAEIQENDDNRLEAFPEETDSAIVATLEVEGELQLPALEDDLEISSPEQAFSDSPADELQLPALEDDLEISSPEQAFSDSPADELQLPALEDDLEISSPEQAFSDAPADKLQLPALEDDLEISSPEQAFSDAPADELQLPALEDDLEISSPEQAFSDAPADELQLPALEDDLEISSPEPERIQDEADIAKAEPEITSLENDDLEGFDELIVQDNVADEPSENISPMAGSLEDFLTIDEDEIEFDTSENIVSEDNIETTTVDKIPEAAPEENLDDDLSGDFFNEDLELLSGNEDFNTFTASPKSEKEIEPASYFEEPAGPSTSAPPPPEESQEPELEDIFNSDLLLDESLVDDSDLLSEDIDYSSTFKNIDTPKNEDQELEFLGDTLLDDSFETFENLTDSVEETQDDLQEDSTLQTQPEEIQLESLDENIQLESNEISEAEIDDLFAFDSDSETEEMPESIVQSEIETASLSDLQDDDSLTSEGAAEDISDELSIPDDETRLLDEIDLSESAPETDMLTSSSDDESLTVERASEEDFEQKEEPDEQFADKDDATPPHDNLDIFISDNLTLNDDIELTEETDVFDEIEAFRKKMELLTKPHHDFSELGDSIAETHEDLFLPDTPESEQNPTAQSEFTSEASREADSTRDLFINDSPEETDLDTEHPLTASEETLSSSELETESETELEQPSSPIEIEPTLEETTALPEDAPMNFEDAPSQDDTLAGLFSDDETENIINESFALDDSFLNDDNLVLDDAAFSETEETEAEIESESTPKFEPDEIQAIFLEEAYEYLEKLNEDLLELDKTSGTLQPDLINGVLRSSHTLKGSAAMVQLHHISELGHKMEDALQVVRDKNLKTPPELVDLLFHAVDAITAMIKHFRETGKDDNDKCEAIIETLVDYTQQLETKGEITSASSKSRFEPDEIQQAFLEEAEEYLENLNIDLLQLDKLFGTEQPEIIHRVLRSAHTIKGSAAMVQLRNISELAHKMEDSLQIVRDKNLKVPRLLVDTLFQSVDAITEMTNHFKKTGEDSNEHTKELIDTLAEYEKQLADTGEIKAIAKKGLFKPNEIQQVFLEEASEFIDKLNVDLLDLDKAAGTIQPDLVNRVMREAHTLKGSAAMVQLHNISELAHKMEDSLQFVRDNNISIPRPLVDVLFQSVDVINEMINHFKKTGTDNSSNQPELVALLQSYFQQLEEKGDIVEVGKSQQLIHAAEPNEALSKASATPKAAPTLVAEQTVRIDITALNNLVNLSAELVIARNRLNNELSSIYGIINQFLKERNALGQISKKITVSIQKGAKGKAAKEEEIDEDAQDLIQAIPVASAAVTFSDVLKEFSESEFDRFSDLDIISRDVKSSILNFDDSIKELRDLTTFINQNIVKVSNIANDLNRVIVGMRMVPVKQMFIRFSRSVRDIAKNEEKKINLLTEGDDTKLDKMVMEDVIEPMMHIVRNAIGHGLEKPEERRKNGKNETGQLILRAYQKGNRVILEVEDDGKGISVEKVKRKAIEKGIITESEATTITPEATTELIFRPGFSTAEKVTELHGRGVGLDVVYTTIRNLKGFVNIETKEGQGTKFIISLPLTLAISDALLIEAAGNTYAIPLDMVFETVNIPDYAIEHEDNKMFVNIRNERIELAYLNALLNYNSDILKFKAMLPVVVIELEDRKVAVGIEKLINKEEIVVKTLGSHLRNVRGVIGATIMGDGQVVIILDMNYLLRAPEAKGRDVYITFESQPTQKEVAKEIEEPKRQKRKRKGEKITVLAADDSPSVRKYIQSVLHQADIDVVSVDDGLNALNKLPTANCDLIITDLEMPRMNGFELVSEVRKLSQYKDIPIIVVTARAGDKHRRKGIELGANAFLNKPFDPVQLIETIESFVS
ncbi:Hpt domain-containing protein [Chloroherpeton thalassium]|nr:Hpt domain-containing protein [Chloroherpeton thalassium]